MGRKTLDVVNVIDIEATCWNAGDMQNVHQYNEQVGPEGHPSEIIQIGITEVSMSTLEILGTHSYFVKPDKTRVSDFCTELTGITQEQLDAKGIPLYEAYHKLKKEHDSTDRIWVSWGDYDRKMFEKSSERAHLKYPFGPRHFNAKALFALALGLTKEVHVSAALEEIGLEFEGRPHDGGDDSKNIAKLWLYCAGLLKGRHMGAELDARPSVQVEPEEGLQTMSQEALVEAARETYAEGSSDDIEVDDDARVSRSERGAFVQMWGWVGYQEAESEEE